MGWFRLVVIDIVNVLRVAVKAENHAPVGPYRNGPKPSVRAFEGMQPEPRQIHVSNGWGRVKRCQDIPQLANMFRVYAARVVLFKKPFQSLVADGPYHPVPQRATWRMSGTIIAGHAPRPLTGARYRLLPDILQHLRHPCSERIRYADAERE